MKRRQFLKNVLYSSTACYSFAELLEACLGSNVAFAQSSSEYNLIHLQLAGGPPRWMFDQPLDPENTGGIVPGGFGTALRMGSNGPEVYYSHKAQTFGGKQVWLPPVWNLSSSTSGEKYSSLLENTMMIRGIDMELNVHGVNLERLLRPVASAPSVHGMLADRSVVPMPAVGELGTAGARSFKSSKGQSIVSLVTSDPIPALTGAFKGNVTQPQNLPLGIQAVTDQLEAYAEQRGLTSVGNKQQMEAAYQMYARDLGSFQGKWESIRNRYRQIIAKELIASFPDINDQGVMSDGSAFFNIGGNPSSGAIDALVDAGTHINRMADGFAIAEFAILEKLSTSVCVSTSNGGRLVEDLSNGRSIRTDQHTTGAAQATYFTSLFYRSLLSCLLELRKQLTNQGVFDKTLIHVGSEFSRTPRTDGSGSDHGFNGSSTSFISGMIDTPGLVGNIRRTPERYDASRYAGTFGEAAGTLMQDGAKRDIVNDDIVNSLTEILQLKTVAVKGTTLVRNNNGRISWLADWEAKNVE